jgi:hypothetical protein
MAKAAAIRTKATIRRIRSSVKLEAERTMNPEDIARRAFELYLARGGAEGDALGDWYRAEQELSAMR